MNRTASMVFAATMVAGFSFAQPFQREAVIRGGNQRGGNPNEGKCTIEVVVDGEAEVQILGSTAKLRTVWGPAAQWRRFECSSPMPNNPPNFRFTGIDGRGRQNLSRNPTNGGAAVVQIEDRDGGEEGYTFDITWSNGRGFDDRGSGGRGDYRRDGGYGQPGDRDNRNFNGDRGRFGHRFTVDEAIGVCRQEILDQAARRFRTQDLRIRRISIDDRPGRNDWVAGVIEVGHGWRSTAFGFSCSVNFDTGRVRSADIDGRTIRR